MIDGIRKVLIAYVFVQVQFTVYKLFEENKFDIYLVGRIRQKLKFTKGIFKGYIGRLQNFINRFFK